MNKKLTSVLLLILFIILMNGCKSSTEYVPWWYKDGEVYAVH